MFELIPNYETYKSLYEGGMSLTQIEKEHGVNRKKLSKLFKQEGVTVRMNGQKYDYNDTFFETVDTEEKAYWLGFLYADGNVDNFAVNEIRMGVSEKDGHHVSKFRELISPDLPYRIKSTKLLGKEHMSYNFVIANKKLVDDVIKLGCVPRKSLILTFPTEEQVPSYLIHHFMRGYFDGDGGITHRIDRRYGKEKYTPQVSVLGTFEFISEYMSRIHESTPEFTITKIGQKKGTEVYHFQKGSILQVKYLYEFLYKDATVYLERKHDKFLKYYG